MNSPHENFRRRDGSYLLTQFDLDHFDSDVVNDTSDQIIDPTALANYVSGEIIEVEDAIAPVAPAPISRRSPGRLNRANRSDRVRGDFDRLPSNMSIAEVFVQSSDKIRGEVQKVFREDLTPFQREILRTPTARIATVKLKMGPKTVAKKEKKDWQPTLNYFGNSVEPIITPEGRYIYSARKYTEKQRRKMYERMEKSRRKPEDSWTGRLKRFFNKSAKPQAPKLSPTISTIASETQEILGFHFLNGLIHVQTSNGSCLPLSTFLNFYSVNSSSTARLIAQAKNLSFQGVAPERILQTLQMSLKHLRAQEPVLCIDSDTLDKVESQKKAEGSFRSELQTFFRKPSDLSSKIVCEHITSCFQTICPQTVLDTKTAYLNIIRDFLQGSIKGMAVNYKKRSLFGSNFISRGLRAFKGSGSLIKDFSYWMREYALNPTDEGCANMYNLYMQKYMDQVSKIINTSESSPDRVLVACCRQLLGYLKK